MQQNSHYTLKSAELPVQEPSIAKSPHVAASFISVETYSGMLQGYVFKTGPRGTGYYIDTYVVYHQNLDELKGRTVRRGPNWIHNNEDGHGIGIIQNIYNISGLYQAEVEWENGNKFNHCRIDSMHDLLFA